MDLGKPERVYTVEPLADPVPQPEPAKPELPDPEPSTPCEPEEVPAGASRR